MGLVAVHPVRVVELGRAFPSFAEALRALGLRSCGNYYRQFRRGRRVARRWTVQPIHRGDADWPVPPPEQAPHSRPVRCIETGEIYPSGVAAARAHYVVKNTLYQAIARGYAANGRHFEWVEEEP